MRLIDADRFLTVQTRVKEKNKDNRVLVEIANITMRAVALFPTACDIDGIKKQLEKCANSYKDSTDAYEQGKRFAYYNAIRIIENHLGGTK